MNAARPPGEHRVLRAGSGPSRVNGSRTLDGMVQAWLIAVALGFGLLLGVLMATLAVWAARRGEQARQLAEQRVPDGVESVLRVLGPPAILVDGSNLVLARSASAVTAGLVQERVHPGLVEILDEVRATGARVARDVELVGRSRREPTRHLSVTAAQIGVRYILLVAEDRTDAVRLDAVRRDFIANVSHELKTPIGAVSLLAEALDSAADDPEQVRRFASRLSAEAQRLAGLTQDIIELSRVQGAGSLGESEPIAVDRLLTKAIEQNHVVAEAKRIELVRGGERGLVVRGHEATLVVAVHNLVLNAVQYSPELSRVGIGVAARGDTIEISVTDHGPGIPVEEQDRIFERFFRSDPARSRQTGGTGLGLSIVKHAVANHGGDVTVWSQPGSGATFTIRLPRADAADTAGPTEGAAH